MFTVQPVGETCLPFIIYWVWRTQRRYEHSHFTWKLLVLFPFENVLKMNYTFSVEHISITGNLDARLIIRQNKQDSMSRFMDIKRIKPKLTQKQLAKKLGFSDSTLKRCRYDIKTLVILEVVDPNDIKKTCKCCFYKSSSLREWIYHSYYQQEK